LNAGYTPVEYYFRIHKCQIPECDKATVDKAYYISRSSDPTFSLYFKTNGNYQSDVFNDLRSKLNGIHGIQDAGITFRKQL